MLYIYVCQPCEFIFCAESSHEQWESYLCAVQSRVSKTIFSTYQSSGTPDKWKKKYSFIIKRMWPPALWASIVTDWFFLFSPNLFIAIAFLYL